MAARAAGGRGPGNEAGLDFYDRLVDGLVERGVEPVATLYHWDLPQELEDAGGWRVRDTASRLAEYASIVAARLGDRVRRWITINEPWCAAWLGYAEGLHAPGDRDLGAAVRATHHLLLAHGLALAELRAAGAGEVGIALNPLVARGASQSEADQAAARRVEDQHNRLFADPLLTGRYPAELARHYARHWAGLEEASSEDLACISQPIDFLGVNFDMWALVEAAPDAPAGGLLADLAAREVPPLFAEATPIGWRSDPGALSALLVELSKTYGCPLEITENGVAANDYAGPDGAVHDPERVGYLIAHLEALRQAIELGADVRSYYHWSLLDNFEWAEGYSKRFGLVFVDYPTQRRIPKDSFTAYREVIAANALP